MRIATWNVNSIRSRQSHLLRWLEQAKPDVVGLQETKVEDGQFPAATIEEAGYHTVISGQKSYNGVALLSREPLEEVRIGFDALRMPPISRLLWLLPQLQLTIQRPEGTVLLGVAEPEPQSKSLRAASIASPGGVASPAVLMFCSMFMIAIGLVTSTAEGLLGP